MKPTRETHDGLWPFAGRSSECGLVAVFEECPRRWPELLAQGADGVSAQFHFSSHGQIAFALVHEQLRSGSFRFRSRRISLTAESLQKLTHSRLKLDHYNGAATERHTTNQHFILFMQNIYMADTRSNIKSN